MIERKAFYICFVCAVFGNHLTFTMSYYGSQAELPLHIGGEHPDRIDMKCTNGVIRRESPLMPSLEAKGLTNAEGASMNIRVYLKLRCQYLSSKNIMHYKLKE